MHNSKNKVLILGQGLAGSFLALALEKYGIDVHIIDYPDPESSSRVAAGVQNPVTGKRILKTFLAEEIFGFLKEYYPSIEKKYATTFYYPKKVYRYFSSVQQQNDWFSTSKDEEYKGWAAYRTEEELPDVQKVNLKWGGIEIFNGGYIDIPTFLRCVKSDFISKNAFEERLLEEKQLQSLFKEKSLDGVKYDLIICCRGYKDAGVPPFDFVPFKPVRGEILSLNWTGNSFDSILNSGNWIFKHADGTYKFGSTYDHMDILAGATEKGKFKLLKSLDQWLGNTYSFLQINAGIRPASLDRRPFVGRHPLDPSLVLFNGLGAKGSTLGPWLADHLAQHLLNNTPLHPEVDILRYWRPD